MVDRSNNHNIYDRSNLQFTPAQLLTVVISSFRVVRLKDELKPRLKHFTMADELGSSVDNTPPVNCFARCLVKLNDSIDDKTLEIVKLVARHALDIKQQDLDDSTVLTAVFNLIEAKYPALAINLLLIILTGLEIQSSLIDELKEYAKSEISKIPRDCRQKMDFILIVSCILRHLQKNQYLSLKEIARRTFLASYNSRNIKSRTHLLHLLLDQNCLTHKSFRELFAWLEVVGCSCLQDNLRDYCQLYNIEEPEWNSLVEPLKSIFYLHVIIIYCMCINVHRRASW